MTKVSYLGPNASTRMKLKRAWLDLVPEIDRCRPLGAEYRALEKLCEEIAATYPELFGEPIRPVNMLESRAGGYARGENAKDRHYVGNTPETVMSTPELAVADSQGVRR